MKKIAPNMPKNMSRLATLASANVRLRKKRMGSIGCSVRSSHATKHASSAAPMTNEATMPAGGPAGVVGATDPPPGRGDPGAGKPKAGKREPRGRPAVLVEPQQDEW